MNWFERYGIAGSYFLAMAFLQLRIFCPTLLPPDEKIMLAIGALFFIPTGYLVSILSQWIIYNLPFESLHIHKRILSHLRKQKVQEALSSTELKYDSELEAETWLALRFRETVKKELRESRTDIMDWARKRWDVLGINAAIILSSYLFLLQSLVNFILFRCHQLRYENCLFVSSVLLIGFITGVTHVSRRMMRNQIIHAYEDFFPRYFKEKRESSWNTECDDDKPRRKKN